MQLVARAPLFESERGRVATGRVAVGVVDPEPRLVDVLQEAERQDVALLAGLRVCALGVVGRARLARVDLHQQLAHAVQVAVPQQVGQHLPLPLLDVDF